MDKKLCPMRFNNMDSNLLGTDIECFEEKCAWWVRCLKSPEEFDFRCVFVDISDTLNAIRWEIREK